MSSTEYKIKYTNDQVNISSPQKQKRTKDIRNELSMPKKKLKMTMNYHDSPHSANPSPITWNYNPVDIEWQRERANSLRIEICNSSYVNFKEPRTVLRSDPPNYCYRTIGDGNCFFRALSLYLTGDENSHIPLRDMVTDHMVRNINLFLVFKNMVNQQDDFLRYIERKRRTHGRGTTYWADADIIIATSSLLKTPIVTYSPHIDDGDNRHLWCTVEGHTLIGEAVYDERFGRFNQTEKQIVLRNLNEHFEPAGF